MSPSGWKFWIDVGGTFTDVVAIRPDGACLTQKVLSSGKIKGRTGEGSLDSTLIDGTIAVASGKRGQASSFQLGRRKHGRNPKK